MSENFMSSDGWNENRSDLDPPRRAVRRRPDTGNEHKHKQPDREEEERHDELPPELVPDLREEEEEEQPGGEADELPLEEVVPVPEPERPIGDTRRKRS